MPACYQLIDKVTKQPAVLTHVDNAMREHFGAPADSVHWYANWHNTLGLSFACGLSEEKIRSIWHDRVEVLDWILEHYTPDCWQERK